MKKKNSKFTRFIGLLLCLVMLIGMMPIHTALALDDPFKTVKYEKVTSVDELIKGNNYVITYKDQTDGKKYALSTDDPGYSALVELKDEDTLMVDPDGSYIFELTKNQKATDSDEIQFKFEANGVGLKVNNSDGVFAASAADIYLDYVDGYWSIQSKDRALTFTNGVFDRTNAAAQYDFEIWTPAPSSSTYIKLASIDQLADFTDDTKFVIVLETVDSHVEKDEDKVKDGLKAIGNSSNWLYDVETITDVDGTEYISVDDRYPVVFDSHGAFTTGTVNKIAYCGFDNGGMKLKDTNNTYFYPQNAGNSSSPFRQKSGENNTVHFEYGTGNAKGNYSDKIYIRGNGNSTYLGYTVVSEDTGDGGYTEKSVYTGRLAQDSEGRLPVQIYVALPDDAVRVEYLDAEGNLSKVAYTVKDGTITLMNSVADVEHNGYTYAFVGWTMTKPDDSFLSLDDSCNIFDYDNETESAHILKSVADKYGLIGDCNADYSSAVINMQDVVLEEDEPLQLYPIYAVRGFDTVVAALEADGTKIIGISDWKADQDAASYYDGGASEKWLGYIDVQMFKDGVEWVKPTRLYYRYHNDNTADLTIKFIWDDLVDEYGKLLDAEYEKLKESGVEVPDEDKLDPLYFFMSDQFTPDQEGKLQGKLPGKEPYPKYDQSGHFVLDAVYALQGGSEDGLKYELNWMTDHGGQLDNVEGGSLVRLFVSTKYDVKYYLDNEEITTGIWGVSNFSDQFYTTPGTENLFKEIASDAEYKVHFDNNDLIALMDRDKVVDEDPDKDADIVYKQVQAKDPETGELLYDEVTGEPIYEDEIVYNPHEWFIAEDYFTDDDGNVITDKDGKPMVKRGVPDTYSYVMHEYEHAIPFAKSPEELVPEGRSLISKNWSLKDQSMKFQSAHEWATAYPLKGTEHGTGNTAASYMENVNLDAYAADAPYTFHLYAYTGIPGDLEVSKTVTGNEGETDREFNFTVTIESSDAFDADDINGKFGDMEFTKGVAEIKLKHGESLTAEALPSGVVTYTVTEAEANQDGYTTTATDDTGTIKAHDTVEAKFVNDRNVIEPEEPIEEPTEIPESKPPKTGDDNNLAMWTLMMMLSLFGMVVCLFNSKKRAKGTK